MNNKTPHVENGYTRIANEIIENLIQHNLTSYQTRVLLAIIRLTYGWNRKTSSISVSQLSRMTGIAQPHLSRTLKELILRNFITRSGKNTSFNKYNNKWKDLPPDYR
ncbi:replication protein [Candidatus Latescibacterota bacterium]